MIITFVRLAMCKNRSMMLLEKLHPVLTYLYTDGSDVADARTLP